MAQNVADILWEMLASAGVKRCYGIVADALSPVIAALGRNGKIEFVHVIGSRSWGGGVLLLESVPGPVWDAQALRHILGGLVVAGHCCRGRPGEIVMQHLSQNIVVG
jgi:hypothetical protein